MNFNDIVYKRVDYIATKDIFLDYVDKMSSSSSYEEFNDYFKKITKIRSTIRTMSIYATIMFSIDTKNEKFIEETNYWNENLPLFEKLNTALYKVILSSPHEYDFRNEYGSFYYEYIKTCVNCFKDEIIPLLQEENKLMSEYTSLLASCNCKFHGEVMNLSGLMGYFGDIDKNKRLEAIKLHTDFFDKNEDKFDLIFDRLVKIRDEIAKKLGYDSFIEVGYMRMNRTVYDEDMVSNFRKNVLNKYLPMANNFYRQQANRISVEKIDYTNEQVLYADSNPKLCVDENEIIDQGIDMYHQMSVETHEFIDYLVKNNLFHVKKSNNKAMGGYCAILFDYKMPFIFGNFNATLDDVDTLTHEFGHAFQVYMSRHEDIPELIFPTLDSCEIYSMSMEYLTYPWMDKFFGEDAEKYSQSHYETMIKFMPYGCLVDHFQHEIYKNPYMTPKERKDTWRRLEKTYCPHRTYTKDLGVLERGGYWYRQGHIFKNPFYYIDYVLAEYCALQFKEMMEDDFENAWNKYLEVSKLGGRYSFIEILKKAGLKNPFELN